MSTRFTLMIQNTTKETIIVLRLPSEIESKMANKNFSLTVYDSEYMETNNKIYQENMEKKIRTISEFPDKVLLKILSLLPSKDVVATGVLSKRWRSLWKDVKTFRYEGESLSRTYWKFARFINRTSSVESLQLKINPSATNKDIQSLVNMAVARSMRELRIEMICKNFELPKSFYMFSQLETVILDKVSLMDPPPDVHLPCLKRLHLLSVKFSGDESVKFFFKHMPHSWRVGSETKLPYQCYDIYYRCAYAEDIIYR